MGLYFIITYPKKGNMVKRVLIEQGYKHIFQEYNEILVFKIPSKDVNKLKNIKYIKKLFPVTLIINFDVNFIFKILEIIEKGIFYVDVRIRDNKLSQRKLKKELIDFLKPNVDKNYFDKYLIIQGTKDKIFISIFDKEQYFERKFEDFSLEDYIKNKYKLNNFKIINTDFKNLKEALSKKYNEKYIIILIDLPNENPKTILNLFNILETMDFKNIKIKKLRFIPNNKRIIILKK